MKGGQKTNRRQRIEVVNTNNIPFDNIAECCEKVRKIDQNNDYAIDTNTVNPYSSKPIVQEDIIEQPFKAVTNIMNDMDELIDGVQLFSEIFSNALKNRMKTKSVRKKDKDNNNEDEPGLFDFSRFYYFSNPSFDQINCYSNTCTQEFLEVIISTPASEAVCERVFRKTSGIVRKSYLTNILPSTVSNLAYIDYYKEIMISILMNEDVERSLMEFYIVFS